MKKDPDEVLVTLTVSGDLWVICNMAETAKQFENNKKGIPVIISPESMTD